MSVRGKVAVELVTIAVLTTIFLLAFPKRSPVVDVGLAGFALLCLALSASYTKKVIWAASPLPVAEKPFKRCMTVVLWVTVPPALLFLLIGGIVAYKNGGCGAGSQLEDTGRFRLLSAVGFDATDAPPVLPFRPIARVVSETVSVGANDNHGNVFRPGPSA